MWLRLTKKEDTKYSFKGISTGGKLFTLWHSDDMIIIFYVVTYAATYVSSYC